MKKLIFLTLSLCCLTAITHAQDDFPYGAFTQDEMNMQQYANDTSAHAVVLNEFGRSRMDLTNDDYIKVIYYYHVKIKIFDNNGIDHGNVVIPLYHDEEVGDEVEDIKGVTTYTDDNGMIKTAELESNKVFKVAEDKHINLLKFDMPAIRKGCIIEYSYTLYTPYWEVFHKWDFQSDIPKIHSEYDIHIPAFWNYNASIRGPFKTTKNIAEVEHDCFSAGTAKCDCSHFVYGMSDIPAFIEEADMTSPKNFLSAIYFEVTDYTSPFDGVKHNYAREWKDVDYELKHADYFGSQLKKTNLFKDKLPPVLAGATDSLDKAKAVYEYIKKTIKWNEQYDYESVDGIRKALNTHTGNAMDINLALVTALSAAGFDAEAVLLSTRDNGLINRLYPALSEFNYVVAKVDIGNKSYLLDATEPLLTFGMLPLRCLNDQGRVMSLDKPSYWIDLNTDQKQVNTYTLDLTLQPDGKIKGTMIHYSMGYAAFEKREEIKKFNSVDEYVESLDEKSSKFKIISSEITNVDSLDLPVSEKYEIEIKEYDSMDHDRLYFNPFLTDRMTVNPFKLADRTYPVDWGMPSVTRYALTMHLPDGYTIENSPENLGIKLPNNGGSFLTEFEPEGSNVFNFSHVLQLNKSIYPIEEYPYLKELFNKVILSEKAQMVFKKKI